MPGAVRRSGRADLFCRTDCVQRPREVSWLRAVADSHSAVEQGAEGRRGRVG